MHRHQGAPPPVAISPVWNGFRFRKLFFGGVTNFALPEHAPLDPRTGKVLVRAWLLAGGGGSGYRWSGGAGGFALKTWLVNPLSTGTMTIGGGGVGRNSAGEVGDAGSQSTLVLDGVTFQATGGKGGAGTGAGAGGNGVDGDEIGLGGAGTGNGVGAGAQAGGVVSLVARLAAAVDLKDAVDAGLITPANLGKGGSWAEGGPPSAEAGATGFGLLLY